MLRPAFFLLAIASARAAAAPGADFDLDKLEAGYTSQYFQSGADGSMVFWCPVNGGNARSL
jgi:hypothetical protein